MTFSEPEPKNQKCLEVKAPATNEEHIRIAYAASTAEPTASYTLYIDNRQTLSVPVSGLTEFSCTWTNTKDIVQLYKTTTPTCKTVESADAGCRLNDFFHFLKYCLNDSSYYLRLLMQSCCFFFSRLFHENFKFLKNCPYDFSRNSAQSFYTQRGTCVRKGIKIVWLECEKHCQN